MRILLRLYPLTLLVFGNIFFSQAQVIPIDPSINEVKKLQDIPASYFDKVSTKADKLNHRLTRRTTKALRRLQKQEEKINRRLLKIDSITKDNLLTRSIDSLSHLREMLRGKAEKVSQLADKIPGKEYIPYLDTLTNALHFLDKHEDQPNQVEEVQQQLQSSLSSVPQFKNRMHQLK